MAKHVWIALLVAGFACLAPAVRAQDLPVLGKSGRFGAGVGIEPLGLGPAESWTRFGGAIGFAIVGAVQLDLGPRWAFRLPLSLDDTIRENDVAYGAMALSPGLLYRWRGTSSRRWIPYVGGAARLAVNVVRRDFVGLPLVTTSALWIDGHHIGGGGGGSDDPNVEGHASLSPELWGGYEVHLNRWLALNLGLVYVWTRVDGENVHFLRETVALRLTL